MNLRNLCVGRLFKIKAAVLIILILFLICLQLASGSSTASQRRPAPSRRSGQGLDSLRENLRSVTGNFQTSLEMKENVDFLLTPALLVQEAISEDVVITYPTE